MKIIKLVDRDDDCYTYYYQVKESQFDRAYKLINDLIGKWYGDKNELYEYRYGGLINFIEYKLEKAKIFFERPTMVSVLF